MTRLEELKAAARAARAAAEAAIDYAYDAWVAYYAELKKLQKDDDR
jgi:hypothetical protein